jgi:dienelactone hydrolase
VVSTPQKPQNRKLPFSPPERTALSDLRRSPRALALTALALALAVAALVFALTDTGGAHKSGPGAFGARHARATRAVRSHAASGATRFAVGLHVVRLQDPSRLIHLPSGATEPRTLVTYVRYPALGASNATDVRDAAADTAAGPFPLVVFGHGFAVTPQLYRRMLATWARAGYVVAAPVFPLENANAPGGPNESDLVNQPADMSLVISRLLAASSGGSGPLAGLIDPGRVAVSGQSDGGDTALAVAYNEHFRDPRVGATVILSGAEIPGVSGFTFSAGEPPLLAVQGSADTVNPPSFTETFFQAARRPKFFLDLPGAEHLPPYSEQEPQLGIVDRVTVAFLDAYLKHDSAALARMRARGNVPGSAQLLAEP